uniref:Putative apolipophorin-iii n=1 Tax=Aedes albopictus TaxID=7160 RepID=A0A1W7R6L1_AEDAL
MTKLLLVVLAILAHQFIAVTPLEGPSSSKSLNKILNVGLKIHEAIEDTHQNVQKALGYQSDQNVLRAVKSNTDELARKLKTISSTVKEQAIKYGEPALQNITDEIVNMADKISREDPETAKKAQEYLASVQSSIQMLILQVAALDARIDKEKEAATNELQDTIGQLFLAATDAARKTSEALEPKVEDD